MWRLFSRTICLLVWYTNYFVLSVTLWVSIFRPPTTNACLHRHQQQQQPPFTTSFFLLPRSLCPSVSLSVTFCVSAIHTHTHTHLDRRRRRRRLLCRASGRCEEVWDDQCVCERRYRQVVFIIIVFFPRRIRRETPTVHVHNNVQQQYKSFVNNTSTLAAARRLVVAPSECVVVSEWGVPVVRENKMYTRLLSRHDTVYIRFIHWNSSYFTLMLLYIMWDVELDGGDSGAARIPSNPPWPNFPHSVV